MNRNRTGRYWGPIFLRSSAAICNAATVFVPSENPDPVNDASTPILTSDFGFLPASTFAGGTRRASSRVLAMTRKRIRIFIGGVLSSELDETVKNDRCERSAR